MRSSRRLMVWLSVDCAIPSFAAALVKLRSLATTRNHSRSLKSAFATGAPRRAGRDLCSWSIDVSELPPLIISMRRCYLFPMTFRSPAISRRTALGAALTAALQLRSARQEPGQPGADGVADGDDREQFIFVSERKR